jgi:hypothetical protein
VLNPFSLPHQSQVPLADRPLLDFPVVRLQVLDDSGGDLVLFVIRQSPGASPGTD